MIVNSLAHQEREYVQAYEKREVKTEDQLYLCFNLSFDVSTDEYGSSPIFKWA